MAMIRTRPVKLTNEQKERLIRLSKSRTEEARRVQRARILLMASDGDGDKKIARIIGLNKNSVH
ncbi:MAG: hypothetical protein LBL05_05215, partial [Synergistaceae bacterium]|nr:hypothetical protein [Synergistaceae bacterium]